MVEFSASSLDDVIVGFPTRAAMVTSGPVFSMPMERPKTPGRLRSISASCFIRASDSGSGSGIGRPYLVSFSLAAGARGDSG